MDHGEVSVMIPGNMQMLLLSVECWDSSEL